MKTLFYLVSPGLKDDFIRTLMTSFPMSNPFTANPRTSIQILRHAVNAERCEHLKQWFVFVRVVPLSLFSNIGFERR